MGIIRLLLALSVVIVHTGSLFGYNMVGGELAVQAFYIISGFYMSLILNEKYVGKGSYSLFISNRFLRLFPVYWIVLALTIILSIVIGIMTHGKNWGDLQTFILHFKDMSPFTVLFVVFSNIFLVFQDLAVFLGLDLHSGHLYFVENFSQANPAVFKFMVIGQAWTVGLEIMFYLVAPYIVRRKLSLIALVILISLTLRFFLYHIGLNYSPWTYRLFANEIVFFMLGNLSYKLYLYFKSRTLPKYILQLNFCSMLAFILIYDFIEFRYKYVIFIIAFFLSLPFIFIMFKHNSLDMKIGDLSYPIYISHIFVFTILSGLKITDHFGKAVPVIIGSILFSLLLNRFVADKVERIRQTRIQTKL
ncbi:MAG: hypothetical protein RIS29_648 [Bacteroidota bacterium]|jgi:peptidoglycan/LPS O-acetylase OafA/YrhL